MEGCLAWWTVVRGQALDKAARSVLALRGCPIRDVDPASLGGQRLPMRTALFIDCGQDLDGGLALLDALEAPVMRAWTVLVTRGVVAGQRSCEKQKAVGRTLVGDRVRQARGLTWWDPDGGDWILDLVRQTLEREAKRREPWTDLAVELARLLPLSPDALPIAAAELARTLMNADLALAATPLPGNNDEFGFLGGQAGEITPQVWMETGRDWNPPKDLCKRACEWGHAIAVPTLERARSFESARTGSTYQACLAVPVRVGDVCPAAIALYWKQARLVTAYELVALEALAAAIGQAMAAAARRLEQGPDPLVALLSPPPSTDREESSEVVNHDADIRRLLDRANTQAPGLFLACWRWSRGAGSPEWVCAGGRAPMGLPGAMARVSDRHVSARREAMSEGTWAVYRPVRVPVAEVVSDCDRDLAGVLCVGKGDASSAQVLQLVEGVAEELLSWLLLKRQREDAQTAAQIAQILTRPGGADQQVFTRISPLLMEALGADGIKVTWRLLREGAPATQQVHRSDMGAIRSQVLPLASDQGWANQVLTRGGWVLADGRPGKDRLWWGGEEWEAHPPAPTTGYWPDGPNPEEAWQVMVPLEHDDGIAGVLTAWREDGGAPFHPHSDLRTLLDLAPYLALALSRVASWDVLDEADAFATSMGRELSHERPQDDALPAVLGELRRMTAGAQVELLLADPDRPRHFVAVRPWGQDLPPGADPVRLHSRTIELPFGVDPAVAVRAVVSAPERMRQCRWIGEPRHAQGLLVVFDAGVPTESPGTNFRVGPLERAMQVACQHLGTQLQNHAQAHALAAAGALAANLNSDDDSGTIARKLLDAIRDEIPGCAVLIYFRRGGKIELGAAAPGATAIQKLTLGRNSLAGSAMEQGKLLCVADLDAERGPWAHVVERDAVEVIAEAARWPAGAGSILACPILDGQQSLGVVKVLTPRGGASLLGASRTTVDELVRRATPELIRARREEGARKLGALSARLALLPEAHFGQETVDALRAWLSDQVDLSGSLAVWARVEQGDFLVRDVSPPGSLSEDWTDESSPVDGRIVRELKVLGRADLVGGVLLVGSNKDNLSGGQREALEDVARELGLLLVSRLIAHEARLTEGMVRHALLAPGQGILNAAEALPMYLQDILDRPERAPRARVELEQAISQIGHEAETMQRGQDILRALAPLRRGQDLEITANRVNLREIVEASLRRFESRFRMRGIRYELPSDPLQRVWVMGDQDLLEIAIANLLDNAVKYSFYNRPLKVHWGLADGDAWVRIEDVGHRLPPGVMRGLQTVSRKLSRPRDPFRTIHGEGLGLLLVRAVVRAHAGNIEATCKVAGDPQNPDPARVPWRVVVTIKLPAVPATTRPDMETS